MLTKIQTFFIKYQEFFYQGMLALMLFIFMAFDKHRREIQYFETFCFFINYYFAALIINYYLLPKYLHRKKQVLFFVQVILLISYVVIVEEFVLEKIFYPNTRGSYFPGVLFSLVDVVPVIIVLVGFKLGWDALKKEKELSALKSKVAESELQFLKSQINPHFLFNNLNNLYAYAIEQSPKTPVLILKLSALLRYMLYDCKEKYVRLSKEVEHLHDFISLNELQLENKGTIKFETSVIPDDLYIAPLILVVFIENAFKHSVSSQVNNIVINIGLDVQDKQLLFVCDNTYQTINNTEQLAKGIGLQNVQARLELLYPNKHTLNITSQNDIYKVELKIDLS